MVLTGGAFLGLLSGVGCGSLVGPDLGAADVVGEVVSVEIAFDVVGPTHTLGRVLVRDFNLRCDVAVRLVGATRVRDGDRVISLAEVAPGDVLQLWTVDPASCDQVIEAAEVRVGGIAQRRPPGGTT